MGTEKKLAICAAAYLTCGVVAFGHSASATYTEAKSEYAACKASPNPYCYDSSTESAATGGFLAALLWPLYLSWEAWS